MSYDFQTLQIYLSFRLELEEGDYDEIDEREEHDKVNYKIYYFPLLPFFTAFPFLACPLTENIPSKVLE